MIHKHLLIGETHLVLHHHIRRKLIHLVHTKIHWCGYTLRSLHLDRISWSFVIHVLTLNILSEFGLSMSIRAFTFVFTVAIYNKIKMKQNIFLTYAFQNVCTWQFCNLLIGLQVAFILMACFRNWILYFDYILLLPHFVHHLYCWSFLLDYYIDLL